MEFAPSFDGGGGGLGMRTEVADTVFHNCYYRLEMPTTQDSEK